MKKEIKISTMVKKMENYLKGQKLIELERNEFWDSLKNAANTFLAENGIPLHCTYGNGGSDLELRLENHEIVIDIDVRYSFTKKKPIADRKYTFKSLVKVGPCFDMSISETIGRRVYGISYKLEEIAYNADKLGYSSIEEMMEAYDKAKKLADAIHFDKISYEFIPEKEKEKFAKLEAERCKSNMDPE
ncbi:hypothetical protein LKD70_03885 [Ruminococcus sp. CLA-AA-H200]|uniref:Uncharacterized protein n=1 Tax=Ruminococcus turbiniformis TaxID=2881258 RepID=A0ABS8FVK4_9FIRM|nr:hypothetical protein [Ruminococcus turbiniformis]MCC2253584.1 hypothetical protein [Ruminococcus turbiniformis]